MALKIGNVEPTQIFIPNPSSVAAPTTISFPTGKKSSPVMRTLDKAYVMATFTSTSAYSCTGVKINDVVVSTTQTRVHSVTSTNALGLTTSRIYYAKFENGTLTLEQSVNQQLSTSITTATAIAMGNSYSTLLIEGTSVDKVQVKKGSSTTAVWGKPYSLVTSSGDCDILAYRNTSPNQHASAGTLTGGGTVYYGDTVQISISPKTLAQYELSSVTINGTEQLSGVADSFNKTLTIAGNTTVNATASKRKPKLTAVTIDGSLTYDSSLGKYVLSVKIYNPNSVAVLADIEIYSNGAVLSMNPIRTTGATATIYETDNTIPSYGAKVVVTISATGYSNEPQTTQTFGDYTDEPETTTTTTTTE